jgi:CheY-like chemotaxis protein
MPFVRLRCHTCGSRVELNLGDMETYELKERGSMNRHCRICRGDTRHDLVGPDAIREEVIPGFRAQEAEDFARGRVLIIEDDAEARTVLAKALVAAHYEVSSAQNGREAVSLLAREDFDAVLADIRMPEFDGRNLFEFLSENFPEVRSKVIFLTGDTGNEETRKFLDETGRPYLSKPVDLPRLFALMAEVVAHGQ